MKKQNSKYQMLNTKNNKGITLVALIITIVVLLILAGVAIGTVRDSDIIGYAKNAAGSYNQAKNNELSEIQSAEDLLEQYASQKNPWQQKGLTVPVEYDKKYTGPVAEGLGISTLTIKLGSDGKLIVEEAGLDTTYNDSKITSITSNTITYNDNGTEIRIEYNADGQSAKVFYNNAELGTLTVEQGGETIVPNTVWAQRGLTVQPVKTDVTYSCEAGMKFGADITITSEVVLYLYSNGNYLYNHFGLIDMTQDTSTITIGGGNTITISYEGTEAVKFVISNDGNTAKMYFTNNSNEWLEGDKTLTLNTVSAE